MADPNPMSSTTFTSVASVLPSELFGRATRGKPPARPYARRGTQPGRPLSSLGDGNLCIIRASLFRYAIRWLLECSEPLPFR